ncbi:hypothetical protein ABEV00_27610 [Paenibacillus thiaminolyticus]|uniref:hypothetical protein n=1 Tax=Paenibacillus thiaminolyticus TaxID=49283 RepID=UPI003D2E7D51
MDEKVIKGIYEWKERLKSQLNHADEEVNSKQAELQLLRTQLEILMDALYKLPESERAGFYDDYVVMVERLIKGNEPVLKELKNKRKILSNRIQAIFSSIESEYPDLETRFKDTGYIDPVRV